jgi:hypothetical protein
MNKNVLSLVSLVTLRLLCEHYREPLHNLPNVNPGGLFPKRNLQALPVISRDDSLYLRVNKSPTC